MLKMAVNKAPIILIALKNKNLVLIASQKIRMTPVNLICHWDIAILMNTYTVMSAAKGILMLVFMLFRMFLKAALILMVHITHLHNLIKTLQPQNN